MFRSEILWVENKRSKLFLTAFFSFVIFSLGVLAFSAIWMAGELGYLGAPVGPVVFPTAPALATITLTSSPTPFQHLPPIATPTAVYIEPVSQVIDGLLTHGQNRPLTKAELDGLVGFLNAAPLALEDNTYYVTFLASETAYRAFPQDYDESLPSYLLRHVAWMDREIKAADPPISGGLIARRLIVVADGAFATERDAHGLDYVSHGLLDSDGSWTFIERYCPEKCGFYNQELGLDFGLTHEWIHTIFKLPDHYALDFHLQNDNSGVFEQLPEGVAEEWLSYMAGGRPDISAGDFAMGGTGSTLRRYSALQLEDHRRRGVRHGSQVNGWEPWREIGFPSLASDNTVLDFGEWVAGGRILIYQSQPCPPERDAFNCKVLNPIPILEGVLNENGRIEIGNPFYSPSEERTYQSWYKEGVLFILIIRDHELGTQFWFRWMDIRDFNLAYWSGYTGSVRMRMKLTRGLANSLGETIMPPSYFNWEIAYWPIEPEEPPADP